jgi:non-heme chloroperoxidase
MNIHAVAGAGGVNLHVREYGRRTGIPILLIHGWSQSHLCWRRQYEGSLRDEFRLVAFDLRGHGMSEAPLQAAQYADGDTWADDLAAIIDRLALDRPILVGWSYGGFVIGDFVRQHGEKNIAGINLVGAIVGLGPKDAPLIGPGFLENAPGMCEADLPTRIAAVRRFVHSLFAKPIPADDLETALAFNMIVDPKVRALLMQRELDYAAALESIRAPVLITQGRSDLMVHPAMADRIRGHCKGAEISWYDDIGHAPFLEDPDRFNRELAIFAKKAQG